MQPVRMVQPPYTNEKHQRYAVLDCLVARLVDISLDYVDHTVLNQYPQRSNRQFEANLYPADWLIAQYVQNVDQELDKL